jgi:hypothetical protein
MVNQDDAFVGSLGMDGHQAIRCFGGMMIFGTVATCIVTAIAFGPVNVNATRV